MDEKKYVTSWEAAGLLNHSIGHIYKLFRRGKLTGKRRLRRVYISRESMIDYLKEKYPLLREELRSVKDERKALDRLGAWGPSSSDESTE